MQIHTFKHADNRNYFHKVVLLDNFKKINNHSKINNNIVSTNALN